MGNSELSSRFHRTKSKVGASDIQNQGVYPQSDGSLGTVNIVASKGFVDLWVHLSFAIFCQFRCKKTAESPIVVNLRKNQG